MLEARAKIDAERATRNNMAAVNVRNKVRVLAESLSVLDVPPSCQLPQRPDNNVQLC